MFYYVEFAMNVNLESLKTENTLFTGVDKVMFHVNVILDLRKLLHKSNVGCWRWRSGGGGGGGAVTNSVTC